MAGSNGRDAVLVDPDLLVPGSQNARERSFWERFGKAIPEHPTVLIAGEFTIERCMEFYLENICDPCATALGHIPGPDLRRLYERALHLQVSPSAGEDGRYQIDASPYRPIYGDDEARIAFELDLNSSSCRHVYTDMGSWEGIDGPTAQVLGDVTLIDCADGEVGCARAFLHEDLSYKRLQEMAPDAFPRLRFCEGAWGSLRKLRSSELKYAPILASYMAILNDQAVRVWERNIGRDKREFRMQSLGVDCSIEQPEDMAVPRLRRMRTFCYHNEDMVMPWHAKILLYTGRMYFLVDVERKYDSIPYVYIGCFTDHFETRNNRKK